jgi:hypothetical protein
MKIRTNRILRKISIGVILIGISSCAQDSIIRVNSTSNLNLLPSTEIRYKSCGETISSCQEILKNINQNIKSKKSELIEITSQKNDAKIAIAVQEAERVREKKIQNCVVSEAMKSNVAGTTTSTTQSFTGAVTVRTDYTVDRYRREGCDRSTPPIEITNQTSSFESKNENSFNLKEETRKIIKEASNTSLNEYTFSKSDGSIVVICQTRYCAIASADGGWIGIGERGKSIEIMSVVKSE